MASGIRAGSCNLFPAGKRGLLYDHFFHFFCFLLVSGSDSVMLELMHFLWTVDHGVGVFSVSFANSKYNKHCLCTSCMLSHTCKDYQCIYYNYYWLWFHSHVKSNKQTELTCTTDRLVDREQAELWGGHRAKKKKNTWTWAAPWWVHRGGSGGWRWKRA